MIRIKGRPLARPALFFCGLAFVALTSLTGCQDAERVFFGARNQAQRAAERGGLAPRWYRAGPFDIRAFERLPATDPAAPLIVYIESDGNAWSDRATLSSDPTPLRPVMITMAAKDPSPGVLYLGRPCQYLDQAALAGCGSAYWSEARFAAEVVVGMNDVVSAVLQRSGRSRVVLVGYSGGGAIAALIAARRGDVAQLVTVASPLDHRQWTSLHGVSPLSRSLNPADEAGKLGGVPQVHLVGARDTIVPRNVVESFTRRLPPSTPARIVVVPDQTHTCCWADIWPDLLTREIRRP